MKDVWQCCLCDTMNDLSAERCSFCTSSRDDSPFLIISVPCVSEEADVLCGECTPSQNNGNTSSNTAAVVEVKDEDDDTKMTITSANDAMTDSNNITTIDLTDNNNSRSGTTSTNQQCIDLTDDDAEDVGMDVADPVLANGGAETGIIQQHNSSVSPGTVPSSSSLSSSEDATSFAVSDTEPILHWQCRVCTLMNDVAAERCVACRTERRTADASLRSGSQSTMTIISAPVHPSATASHASSSTATSTWQDEASIASQRREDMSIPSMESELEPRLTWECAQCTYVNRRYDVDASSPAASDAICAMCAKPYREKMGFNPYKPVIH